jgi:dienelactone hydrolase
MSQNTERHPIAMKKVVCQIPRMESVVVRRDELYRITDTGPLTMDGYYPPDAASGARLPAVIVVQGYLPRKPNPLGCKFKEMEWSVSWGQLIAASGIVAIFYTNLEPEADLRALLHHIRKDAESLGIDEHRIGLLATSGHAPLALSVMMQEGRDLKCAVLCYPFTLDLDGATAVAEAAEKWGFVTAAAGKSVRDLPQDLPLFIARAGQDEFPHLNEALDRFLTESLARNLPLTFVNHPDGPHAFDLFHDSEATREIVRQILSFLQFHLQALPREWGAVVK